MASKPGIKTSEFWATAFVTLSALAAAAFGVGEYELDPETAGAIAAGGVAVYAVIRGWTKASEAKGKP